eukprot:6190297-Amphidinium_carterae.1
MASLRGLSSTRTVETAGIRHCHCGLCKGTFCVKHSHCRDIRGQRYLVCRNCVATHPQQLPKLHSGVPLLSQVNVKRRPARDPAEPTGSAGKRSRLCEKLCDGLRGN